MTTNQSNQFETINGETELRDLARVTSEELMDAGDMEDIRPPRDNAARWARWGAKMTMLRAILAEVEGRTPGCSLVPRLMLAED